MNVRELFTSLGWLDFGHDAYKNADLYELRIQGTPCACNDKLYLHAVHYSIPVHGKQFESVEFVITGEASDGQWFDLNAYGVRVDDLTTEVVDQIRVRLQAAWEAAQSPIVSTAL